MPIVSSKMHGQSVSPDLRVRNPALSVWYQIFCSAAGVVLTWLMKSTSPAVTVTI